MDFIWSQLSILDDLGNLGNYNFGGLGHILIKVPCGFVED
jgi:hypothetical protein